MSFRDLEIKQSYRSYEKDVIRDFYIPVLKETKQYDRAVGYFSSTALLIIYPGILGLVRNGGKIRLIFSPQLSLEDTEAINNGLKLQESEIEDLLIEQLELPSSCEAENRLDILTNLIALEILDIRIVTLENDKGIFHSKIAILTDCEGNRLAFTGSANETASAFENNVEEYDVYLPWNENELNRINEKTEQFEKCWNDEIPGQRIHRFPKLKNALIEKYRKTEHTLESIAELLNAQANKEGTFYPDIPEDVQLRDYQLEAIRNWESKDFKGIFDMATGTGKTYTAIAAACRLYEVKQHLAIVIICPMQHLIEQWAEDIKRFNMDPILCYSVYPKWKYTLERELKFFKTKVISNICVLVTNDTFTTPKFQRILKDITDGVLIVDEAHNVGTKKFAKYLPESFDYRLALSATIERYRDEEGTQVLYDYFGEKCIEFGLKEAIDKHMLTPYLYYPVIISLTEDERLEYEAITEKLSKYLTQSDNDVDDDYAQIMLIKRARIVAGAKNKLIELEKYMEQYKQEDHILVYCGVSKVKNHENLEDDGVKQITNVIDILGNKLNMSVVKFTSEEDIPAREKIKIAFEEGIVQVMVAMRCLDEGVNIPSIKTVFILASSTNPKEYIQRRGRVLRKFPGKDYAVIFDFITVPYPIDNNTQKHNVASYQSLLKNELTRLKEFGENSMNNSDSYEIADKIRSAYLLTNIKL